MLIGSFTVELEATGSEALAAFTKLAHGSTPALIGKDKPKPP